MVRGRTCIRCVAAIAVRVTQLQQSELVIGPGTFAKKKDLLTHTTVCVVVQTLHAYMQRGVCSRSDQKAVISLLHPFTHLSWLTNRFAFHDLLIGKRRYAGKEGCIFQGRFTLNVVV